MSRSTRNRPWTGISFPRVSGDEPAAEKSFRRKLEFSPREWG